MAITTLDGALAGMKQPEYFAKALTGTTVAGRPFSSYRLAGIPGPAAAPATGIAGAAITSEAGQIPVPPASGTTYLGRFSGVSSAQSGILLLCDRLWCNSGIVVTVTTGQTINSVAFAARDKNGTTNGEGVIIGMEIITATGGGSPSPTITYTNQSGTGSKTGSMQVTYVASSVAGTFYPFTLAVGDSGVRSIQTYTSSISMTSGAISLVAYRVLASLELSLAGTPSVTDPFTGGLPKLFDNSVPFILFVPQTTTTTLLTGSVAFTQG